ncbi:hypothetical protein [Pantoea sp. aB]|jgi:hypothetical protein|uniref:hypothetical protein n=1 Tax=Pantoea sp. aB TaxID=517433 RepID=UPI0001E0BBEE|nr:hypothetical protein [Pantoea sp. aB]EFM17772.1 hypothetical protein PanABDRAFT_4283 [Pantoea sp. aB]
MNDVYGRMIPDTGLPIQKTVLASSERTGVRLLDCGEDCQGRYEVITENVLVACTDDYARAREYYFKETSRLSAECQTAYNIRAREAKAAGLIGYIFREYACNRITMDQALLLLNTPRGIPAESLPAYWDTGMKLT